MIFTLKKKILKKTQKNKIYNNNSNKYNKQAQI
jgi:hypothetical protein